MSKEPHQHGHNCGCSHNHDTETQVESPLTQLMNDKGSGGDVKAASCLAVAQFLAGKK